MSGDERRVPVLEAVKRRAGEALDPALDAAAERLPRLARRVTLALLAAGLGLLALGVLALVAPALFYRVLAYVLGAALVLAGAGLVWLAWRVRRATRAVRALGAWAQAWRERLR